MMKIKPFFMYFNPTVPHASNSIDVALNDFSCQDTADGTLDFDPMIPGMTQEFGSCAAYRQSIIERSSSPDDYGPIWLDDSVGALLKALEEKGILQNTVFLFQIDHGVDVKSTVYEGGVRIPQFIHYPAEISGGTKSDIPVSTLDISATILDFAGIDPTYDVDGESWRNVIGNSIQEDFWNDGRCLFFENQEDRAVRCGCYKYLTIFDENNSDTYTRGSRSGLSIDPANLFDLCEGTVEYITDQQNNQEASNLITSEQAKATDLLDALECHLERTASTISDFRSCHLYDPPVDDGTADSDSPSVGKSHHSMGTALIAFVVSVVGTWNVL